MRKIGGYIRPWTAAEYLGISLSEVQKMLESGELPGIKIDGQWRVPLDRLEKWLDEDVSERDLHKLAGHLDLAPQEVDSFLKDAMEDVSKSELPNKPNGIPKKKK